MTIVRALFSHHKMAIFRFAQVPNQHAHKHIHYHQRTPLVSQTHHHLSTQGHDGRHSRKIDKHATAKQPYVSDHYVE